MALSLPGRWVDGRHLGHSRRPVTDQRLVVFVPWSEIQKGLPALCELPQGFSRLGSVMVASPGMSETRSV
jgi:hypothetical protein